MHTHTHTVVHTCTTHGDMEERGTRICSLPWHFIFKPTKSFIRFHTRAVETAVHTELEPPGREHSSRWKSSRLKRRSPPLNLETICLSAPAVIWSSSDILLPLPRSLFTYAISQKLIKLNGTFLKHAWTTNGGKLLGCWKKLSMERNNKQKQI